MSQKLEYTSECLSQRKDECNEKTKLPSDLGVKKVESLSCLCYKVIASKLERYPPESFCVFSEIEWDRVVKLRHQLTEPKKVTQRKNANCLNGVSGRMTPAISEKFLVELEHLNPHLAKSEIVNKLIWKDIVEYKFRRHSPSRPLTLLLPWPMQVERLKDCGKNLLQLLSTPSDQASTTGKNEALQKHLETMVNAPMNVPLLTASGIGKNLHKVLKLGNKMSPQNTDLNLWSPINISGKHAQTHQQRIQSQSQSLSAIEHFDKILKGWKNIASANGVDIQSSSTSNSKNSSDPLEYSGRSRQTTEEQHARDVAAIQTCQSWRQLYATLVKREDNRLKKHGARMREIRQNLENNRSKVEKVKTKTARNGRNNLGTASYSMTNHSSSCKERLQAVLSGKPLTAVSSSQFSTMSKSKTKILQLRKEAKHVISRQMGGPKTSSFGNSVASASCSSKKRAIESKGREITFGAGKKMRLPKSSQNTSQVTKNLFSRKTNR